MRLVVDASVAVKWLVQEENSEIADSLRQSEHDLLAPRFMELELGNVIWGKTRRGDLARPEAIALMESLVDLPVEWWEDDSLIQTAIRLALELNHPAYDCLYLALAHRLDAIVVTADTRFGRAAAGTIHADTVLMLEQFAVT